MCAVGSDTATTDKRDNIARRQERTEHINGEAVQLHALFSANAAAQAAVLSKRQVDKAFTKPQAQAKMIEIEGVLPSLPEELLRAIWQLVWRASAAERIQRAWRRRPERVGVARGPTHMHACLHSRDKAVHGCRMDVATYFLKYVCKGDVSRTN